MGKTYSHDMSQESEKGKLLDEGWHEFEVVNVEETISKAGNDMFKITLAETTLLQKEEIYAIAVKGKRWFLKQFLAACEVPASQDGVYDWDIDDVIGKIINGRVEHQEETFIDRDNNTRTVTKGKIVKFSGPQAV